MISRLKIIVTLVLLLGSASMMGQSKISYSLIINESASADDTYDVCILRTTGGQCIDLERNWSSNVTAAVNYQLSKRIRIQSGLAYNQMTMDNLNEALNKEQFKINYLSIPIRSHFFVTTGKVRWFAGLGLRTDIRLNKAASPTTEVLVQDNARSVAVSAEMLAGIEFNIIPQLALSIEPTFSRGITSYSKDVVISPGAPNASTALPYQMMPEKPQRMGMSLGFTYSFGK